MGVSKRRTHGWPGRLPPISGILDRYAESALVSAIRLRRYWIMQGDSPERATEKAIRQAIGMMVSSGVPLSRLIMLFEDIKNAADAFIKMIKDVREELRMDMEIEYLFEQVGKEPYTMNDYGKKKRKLTLKIKEILKEIGCEEAYKNLKKKKGFEYSEKLLDYSSKAFKRIVNSLIAYVKRLCDLNPMKELQLRKKILLAVAEVKYGREKANQLEKEAQEHALTLLD